MKTVFISVLAAFACVAAVARGPIERVPDTVRELAVGYGRDPESAEKSALAAAASMTRTGAFDLKSISISGKGKQYFCVAGIEHLDFDPEDKKAVREATVGYGDDWESAQQHAMSKAYRMASRDQVSGTNDGSKGSAKAKATANDVRLKSIRFSGLDDMILCYIQFEYFRKRKLS